MFCSIAAGAIGISTFGDFVTYTALGWFYKTAVEVIMLPVTYRVIAYIKRHEPTYRRDCMSLSLRLLWQGS